MTKVEELRDELLAWYENPDDDRYEVESRAYALIAAARAEGAAEERERIVCGSQRFPKGEYVVDSDYISMVFSHDGIGEAMTDCELFIIPASVLAPEPKEEK